MGGVAEKLMAFHLSGGLNLLSGEGFMKENFIYLTLQNIYFPTTDLNMPFTRTQ
jgi:hypothetical protein